MPPLLLLIAFVAPAEIAQLVLAERRVGLRQIRAGIDPRDSRHTPPDWIGWLWLALAFTVYAYPVCLVFERELRFFGLMMLLFGVVGFDLRRRLGLKWVLVVLTFEGALRIGVMILMLVLYFWFGFYGSSRVTG